MTVLINMLRMQGIEVGSTKSEVQVKEGTFPAGSYVIKRDQPYGRLAKNLLEKQVYPDPVTRTYDDASWTMGMMSHTDVKEISDKAVLDVAVNSNWGNNKHDGSVPFAFDMSATATSAALVGF